MYEKWTGHTIPVFQLHNSFRPAEIKLTTHSTQAPPLLTESNLIAQMEKNGIGTDATIAQHILKIQEREYASCQAGMFYPTDLGTALVDGYRDVRRAPRVNRVHRVIICARCVWKNMNHPHCCYFEAQTWVYLQIESSVTCVDGFGDHEQACVACFHGTWDAGSSWWQTRQRRGINTHIFFSFSLCLQNSILVEKDTFLDSPIALVYIKSWIIIYAFLCLGGSDLSPWHARDFWAGLSKGPCN